MMQKYNVIRIMFSLLMLIFATSLAALGQRHTCKLTIGTDEWQISGRENASMVKPGDTICLESGQKQFLWLSYLHGTCSKPIVVINSNGIVDISRHYYGVKIDSCSHVVFSGQGVSGIKYGIFIHNVNGAGLSIQGLSTDIEVMGIEISRTELVGIFAKTDPDELFNSTREKYVQRNTIIHDNYIHHTKMEGMYIGNSHYFGIEIPWHGHDTLVYPHSLKGVQIYSNHIDSTGWDGIQVSSADSGCFIHHNYVYADSQLEEPAQMSGILIGGGSNCDCYNNSIMNGKGDGIDVFGQGIEYIYNNFIFQAGRNYRPADLFTPFLKVGIYAGKTQMNMPSTLGIFYNTIVYPKSYGIRFAEYPGTENLASSNIVVGPGLYYKEGDKAFIMKENSGTDFVWFNNITNAYCKPVGFRDTSSCNYDLLPSSPAVDKGSGISGLMLDWDFMCRWRPFARGPDIGAFECHDQSLIGIPESEDPTASITAIYPNPARGRVMIEYRVKESATLEVSVFNGQGERMAGLYEGRSATGLHRLFHDVGSFAEGQYYIVLNTPTGSTTRILIVAGD